MVVVGVIVGVLVWVGVLLWVAVGTGVGVNDGTGLGVQVAVQVIIGVGVRELIKENWLEQPEMIISPINSKVAKMIHERRLTCFEGLDNSICSISNNIYRGFFL